MVQQQFHGLRVIPRVVWWTDEDQRDVSVWSVEIDTAGVQEFCFDDLFSADVCFKSDTSIERFITLCSVKEEVGPVLCWSVDDDDYAVRDLPVSSLFTGVLRPQTLTLSKIYSPHDMQSHLTQSVNL